LEKNVFVLAADFLCKPPTMSAQPSSAAAAENFTRRAAAENFTRRAAAEKKVMIVNSNPKNGITNLKISKKVGKN
jgi:hypothetical protein